LKSTNKNNNNKLITSGQSNLTTCRIAAAYGRLHQSNTSSMDPPESNSKLRLDRFSRFLQGSLLWQTDKQTTLPGL